MTKLARATAVFARSVYVELKRAGYEHDDVLRFISEVMDCITADVGASASGIEPPGSLDPECGIPNREAVLQILDFEFRRASVDRRDKNLFLAALDVKVPTEAAQDAHSAAHRAIAETFGGRLRNRDVLGRLGRERYLLILPDARETVVTAMDARLQQCLEDEAFPGGAHIDIRWMRYTDAFSSANQLMEACFRAPCRQHAARSSDAAATASSLSSAVVLALGGGTAQAASHAGVLRALEAARIGVCGLAGSSLGALVAVMHASKMSHEVIVAKFANFPTTPIYRAIRRAYVQFERAQRQQTKRLAQGSHSSLAFQSQAILSAAPQSLLEQYIEYFAGPDRSIASLRIPLAIVATDLIEGRPVAFTHGSIHTALAASCALPGLFPPQRVEDVLAVDGSAVLEVPVGSAYALGMAAPVMAVQLQRTAPRIKSYRTSAEVFAQINALTHIELVREQVRHAHLRLAIPTSPIGWLDFHQADVAAELGEIATNQVLNEIRRVCEMQE